MLAKADALPDFGTLTLVKRVANNLKGTSWLNLPPALKRRNPTL